MFSKTMLKEMVLRKIGLEKGCDLGKKCCHRLKMGLRKGCGLGKRCCLGLKMRLGKGCCPGERYCSRLKMGLKEKVVLERMGPGRGCPQGEDGVKERMWPRVKMGQGEDVAYRKYLV